MAKILQKNRERESVEKYPKLINPCRLSPEQLSGEVITFPNAKDYKPNIAVLPNGELVMFSAHQHFECTNHGAEGSKPGYPRLRHIAEHTVIYRSRDLGRTWSRGEQLDIVGHEPSVCVIDGLVFVQTHVIPTGYGPHKRVVINLYRSEDNCRTWQLTVVAPDMFPDYDGSDAVPVHVCCRLPFGDQDGNILFGASFGKRGYRFLSRDKGLTWELTPFVYEDRVLLDYESNPEGPWPAMFEAICFRSPSGRLMAVTRIKCPYIDAHAIPDFPHHGNASDPADSLLLIESKDNGITWRINRAVGIPCIQFPSVVNLSGNEMLFTFTVRMVLGEEIKHPYRHMGVQAVIMRETPDGSIDLDLNHDLIVIDDRTPDNSFQGGGFGRTMMLPDGSLITPYSYLYLTAAMKDILDRKLYEDVDWFRDYSDRCCVDWNELHKGFYENWPSRSDRVKRAHLLGNLADRVGDAYPRMQVLRWRVG